MKEKIKGFYEKAKEFSKTWAIKIYIFLKKYFLIIWNIIKKVLHTVYKAVKKFVKKHKKLSIFFMSILLLILILGIMLIIILNKKDPPALGQIPVSSVEIDEENAVVYLDNVGDEHVLTAVVYPANAYNKDLVWSSSNSEVVSVDDNGVIKLLRGRKVDEEEIRISVETIDGGFIDSVKVIVPIYNDYETMLENYLDRLEVNLINKEELLFPEISILMIDKIEIPSIVEELEMNTDEYVFNWSVLDEESDIIGFENVNPSTGMVSIIPKAIGEETIVFECVKDNKVIIRKELVINVVIEDVLSVTTSGLNETYKQGEIINVNNIILNVNYRDSYGNLGDRTIPLNKAIDTIDFNTSKVGMNEFSLIIGNKEHIIKYEVLEVEEYHFNIIGLKLKYGVSENLLNAQVVITIDEQEYEYSLLNVDSNARDIDMNEPGKKTLSINYMGSKYDYFFDVVSDECDVNISGLYNKYPQNSKLLYDEIIVNVEYVNDYYQDINSKITDFYTVTELDEIFKTDKLGKQNISLNINNMKIEVSYEVVKEIVNVEGLQFLIPIENEYKLNEEFTLSVKPNYRGYTIPFNNNDIMVYIDGEESIISSITKSSGNKRLKFVYGDYSVEYNVNVLHLIDINYYVDGSIKETAKYYVDPIEKEVISLNSYTGYEYTGYDINSGSLILNIDDNSLHVTVFDQTTECSINLKYDKKEYSITYKIPGEKSIIKKYLYQDAIEKYEAPEKDGYIFVGWDMELPEKMPAYDIVINGKYESSDNTIFYIKYFLENNKVANYIETFSVKGDSNAVFNVDSSNGLSIKIIEDSVIFETTRNYDGYSYDSYKVENNTCEVYFKLNEYKITYVLGDEEISFTYKYLQNVEMYNPDVAGYEIKWLDEVPSVMPAHDIVITGEYYALSYKLMLDNNGDIETYIYKYNEKLDLPVLTDIINVFNGWYDSLGKKYEYMPAHDIVLYSSWTVYKKVVSYNIEGLDSFYLINDIIDLDNVYITYVYEDNTNEKININDLQYVGSFETSNAGIYQIVVYNQNQKITLKYEVSKELKEIVEVSINNFPSYFYLNENVNLDDYMITITYTNEIVVLPLNDPSLIITGFDTKETGYKTINISYYNEILNIPYQVVDPIIVSNTNILSLNKEYSFVVSVDRSHLPTDFEFYIEKNNKYEASWLLQSNGSYLVTVACNDKDVDVIIGIKDVPCKTTVNIKQITIDDLNIELVGNDYAILNKTTGLYVIAYYQGFGYTLTDCTYEWSVDTGAELIMNGNYAEIKNEEIGYVTISVKIIFGGFVQTVTKKIEVIDPYVGLAFTQDKHYGIGEIYTVGGLKYSTSNNIKVSSEYLFDVIHKGGTLNRENLTWYTSDEKIATFGANGELNIHATGYVTLYAVSKEAYKYNIKDANYVGSMTIRCVYDAVMVSNYEDLKLAFSENCQVVLENSIDIGPNVMTLSKNPDGSVTRTKNPNMSAAVIKNRIKDSLGTIQSTWECDFLNNLNKSIDLNYCLEITNNLYGNGYILDCYQITTASSLVGRFGCFEGPLDLVSLINAAAVKGQDDIGFIIRDNVTVDNVILQNCDDGYLYQGDLFNYSKLETVGTTVEVMGDNVNIINSRIKNGRNVLRIYGTENPDEVINVNIESSIISNAREFLIKIGTNKSIDANAKINYKGEEVYIKDLYKKYSAGEVKDIIDGDSNLSKQMYESVSPYLPKGDGTYYTPKNDNNQYDNEFVEKYVKTNVIIKNCVLENTGFFAVGLESKFGGPILGGYRYAPRGITVDDYEGVYNISGTSYAALLRLEGDVRIYNWKKLDDVNSSSLIEKLDYALILEEMGHDFTFDVKKLISNISVEPGYENIIADYNGEKYAHGGIVFYGGGRNYHMINLEKYTGKEYASYLIDSSKLGDSLFATVLPIAAGREPFRFFMFDSTSEFSYEYQINEIKTGNAYKWIEPVK